MLQRHKYFAYKRKETEATLTNTGTWLYSSFNFEPSTDRSRFFFCFEKKIVAHVISNSWLRLGV
jgi:hypothetical protein